MCALMCVCLDPMCQLSTYIGLFSGLITISFSGKDSAKIFSKHKDLFAKVPVSFKNKQNHKVLFETLNLIFSKTKLARFLTAVERTNLEENVINLSKIIHIKFKHKSITIKMHDVLGKLSNIFFSNFFLIHFITALFLVIP